MCSGNSLLTFKDNLSVDDGTTLRWATFQQDAYLSTNIRCAMSRQDAYLSTNIRCAMSQKSETQKLHRGGNQKSRTCTSLSSSLHYSLNHSLINKQNTQRIAFLWVTTQWVVVISYWDLGTTYRSHPQGSGFFNHEYGTDRLCRNVGKYYHYSLRNNP